MKFVFLYWLQNTVLWLHCCGLWSVKELLRSCSFFFEQWSLFKACLIRALVGEVWYWFAECSGEKPALCSQLSGFRTLIRLLEIPYCGKHSGLSESRSRQLKSSKAQCRSKFTEVYAVSTSHRLWKMEKWEGQNIETFQLFIGKSVKLWKDECCIGGVYSYGMSVPLFKQSCCLFYCAVINERLFV